MRLLLYTLLLRDVGVVCCGIFLLLLLVGDSGTENEVDGVGENFADKLLDELGDSDELVDVGSRC